MSPVQVWEEPPKYNPDTHRGFIFDLSWDNKVLVVTFRDPVATSLQTSLQEWAPLQKATGFFHPVQVWEEPPNNESHETVRFFVGSRLFGAIVYSYLLYYVRRGYRITAIMLPSQGRNESSTLSTRTMNQFEDIRPLYRMAFCIPTSVLCRKAVSSIKPNSGFSVFAFDWLF